MQQIFGRLCCQPGLKRKPSIKLATPPSVEIPSTTPPAPPPSRAHGTYEPERIPNPEASKPESASEFDQRLRAAGHTPGPPEPARPVTVLKPQASAPEISESLRESLPRMNTRKTWSSNPDVAIPKPSLTPTTFEPDKHISLGGDERLMTTPSQRRYSEDVADRNIEKYGGIDQPNSPPGGQPRRKSEGSHDSHRVIRASSLPPLVDDHEEHDTFPRDTKVVTPNEYEGRILVAPDLGQFTPARYQNQPSAWASPNDKPLEAPSEQKKPPVIREESYQTFLRTTEPPNRASRPNKSSLQKQYVDQSGIPRIREPSSSDDEQDFPPRKTSNTPSMGVSRYSTAKASLPSDGDDDDAAETDRVVKWKGFGN